MTRKQFKAWYRSVRECLRRGFGAPFLTPDGQHVLMFADPVLGYSVLCPVKSPIPDRQRRRTVAIRYQPVGRTQPAKQARVNAIEAINLTADLRRRGSRLSARAEIESARSHDRQSREEGFRLP